MPVRTAVLAGLLLTVLPSGEPTAQPARDAAPAIALHPENGRYLLWRGRPTRGESPADIGGTERPPLHPPRPEVRCGIKVLPADPAVDPRIAIPVPNGSVNYRIRSVQPPACDE
jgi:hypothetical protein